MSWRTRGGSCVMSSTNGRWDDAGPGMLWTNVMPWYGHVTGSANEERGMLRGMLGWAGLGDARQSERSSSHQMRGSDTDTCELWGRVWGKDEWANETRDGVVTCLILFPDYLKFLSKKIHQIFILRIHVLWQGYWHHASANEMLQHPHTAAGAGRLWPYVASWHHPMMARDVEISCVRKK